MINPVIQAIMDRRSIRAYKNEPVSQELKQILLDAALASPSAANRQPWHFTFVEDQALLDEVNDAMRENMRKNNRGGDFTADGFHVFFHAPLAVFISGPANLEGKRFAEVDAGIAVENLAIAAQGLGLGSCILGLPADAFRGDKGPELSKKLCFPDGYAFKVAISIGWPDTTKEAHPIGENKYTFLK